MLKNKTFGSALIIAGTTIGAGMLAMPLILLVVDLYFQACQRLLEWTQSHLKLQLLFLRWY